MPLNTAPRRLRQEDGESDASLWNTGRPFPKANLDKIKPIKNDHKESQNKFVSWGGRPDSEPLCSLVSRKHFVPHHLPSTFFFLHSIYKLQMEKRQRSIKQRKERGLMNIFLGIRAIGVCEREWRQFACSSLVFSARDLDSSQGTDRALWSRSFLRSARVCYGGTVPSLFCWSAIQSPTRFHQEQIWFHSYHPDSQGVGSFSLNNRTSSFCNSWAPSLTAPTYPAPSLSSKNGEEVNHIIILGSINYVNFVGNNIKYGNSPSLFLNPLHFLTSVTPIVERIQLQRHLGNVIMLIYCL